MTPEERDLLQKTFNLSQENNQMLHKMEKSGKTTRIVKYFYWGFIIVATIASIYFGSLYVDSINSAVNDTGNGTSQTTSSTGVSGMYNNLQQLLQ
jgi:hypothetical protein